MTAVLGISAFFHDAAAALVVDGEIVAAAQEERFSRCKHDHRLPTSAIRYCLGEAGLEPGDLDCVAFYDKPLRKFDRLLETYLAFAPRGFASFLRAMPLWLHEKLHLPRRIRAGLGGSYEGPLVFTEHHEAHAASAFFPSPFPEAAILTVDGVGEWATATLGHGRGERLHLTHELRFPHSLGLLYSAFTSYCGFRVNSGEYKLMGLAPYGVPRHADLILERLVDLREDGSFRLDLSYFDYCHGLSMTSKKFERLFGGPPRTPESPLGQREMDLAASTQRVTEEIMLRMARHLHRITGSGCLCLAGGVALNCVANGRIRREGPFEELWIQPAAGDAGGALGAALFVWHQLLGHGRPGHGRRGATPVRRDRQRGSFLGPAYGEKEIRRALDEREAVYRRFSDEAALLDSVCDLIAGQQVVGWYQGRMEFGPRALGDRSILADARGSRMQSVVNRKIKFRESFRPFAPAVLRERVADWFEVEPGEDSPYMLLVAAVRRGRTGSGIPAVTHVDGSARVQTVDPERHGRFHRLLAAFERKTGCPVLINTSLNVRGEPIVCTPEEAWRCFMGTEMDALVLGDFLLLASEQPPGSRLSRAEYVDRFELD